MKIWGELLLFAYEEGLLPDATRSAVVVVTGDGVDGNFQLADGGAERGDCGLIRCRGVEEVATDEDEL